MAETDSSNRPQLPQQPLPLLPASHFNPQPATPTMAGHEAANGPLPSMHSANMFMPNFAAQQRTYVTTAGGHVYVQAGPPPRPATTLAAIPAPLSTVLADVQGSIL
jgi:hypothetical protein